MLVLLLACPLTNSFAATTLDIDIKGVDGELLENINHFLSIVIHKDDKDLSKAKLKQFYSKADSEIKNALKPFGYYQVKIKKELKQISEDNWSFLTTIDKGPPLVIKSIDIQISDSLQNDQAFIDLLANNPLAIDQVLVHSQYESVKSRLINLAADRGYFKAVFTKNAIEIDLRNNSAHIYIYFNGGKRYRYGTVTIMQSVISDALLQRYIPFTTGSPYLLLEVIELQQALNDSDYFQNVEVSTGKADDVLAEIPIDVRLTPRKPHRIGYGIGYGTDTGARAKFSWEMPRLNLDGHRFAFNTTVSEIGYNLSAQYKIPILNPRTDQLIYSSSIVNEKTDTNESTIKSIGSSIKRSRNQWRETLSINYQDEDFIIADVLGNARLLIPSANWNRTWADKVVDVTTGTRFDFDIRGASEALASDVSFTQVQLQLKNIISINSESRLLLRGNFGSTQTNDFEQLPSSVRFFTGGAQTVRGYSYQSLGPRDINGKVIGGQYLIVGSIEYEHRLDGKWSIATFYDTGNAINDLNDKLESGIGFGFRWQSPIGPVRINIANAVSTDEQNWRLHITIGPDL